MVILFYFFYEFIANRYITIQYYILCIITLLRFSLHDVPSKKIFVLFLSRGIYFNTIILCIMYNIYRYLLRFGCVTKIFSLFFHIYALLQICLLPMHNVYYIIHFIKYFIFRLNDYDHIIL